MSKQQKKMQKKKERERESRKKVLHRREVMRETKKAEQAKEDQMEAEYLKQQQDGLKPMPIINDPAKRDAAIKARLERNLKILEALEQEYQKEQAQRKEVNAKLEGEGAMTLKEKIEYLNKMAKQDGTIAQDIQIEPDPTPDEALENMVLEK